MNMVNNMGRLCHEVDSHMAEHDVWKQHGAAMFAISTLSIH